MKKFLVVIVVIVVAAVTPTLTLAQINSNVVIGNGLYYNANNDQGTYRYCYLDILPVKISESAALGLFALGSQNSGMFEGNYKEKSHQYGGGLVLGLEPQYLLYNADIYIDFHLGYMYSQKDGEDNKGWNNKQEDHFLYFSTYAHIDNEFKYWFYRHKLFVSAQYSFNSQEESFWEDNPIDGQIWDMSTLQVRFEESVYRAQVGSWTLTPKILMGYSYQLGDNSSYVEPGIGLDIFIKYYQNLLELHYQRKMSIEEDGHSYHMLGVSLNLVPLFKSMGRK